MKKVFAMMLAAAMLFSLCACGAKSDGSRSADSGKEYAASVFTDEDQPDPLTQFKMDFGENTRNYLPDRLSNIVDYLDRIGKTCCYVNLLYDEAYAVLLRNNNRYFRVLIGKADKYDRDFLFRLAVGKYSFEEELSEDEESEVQTLEIDGNEYFIQYRKDGRAFLLRELDPNSDMNIIIAEEIGILDKFLMENFDK